MPYLDYVVSDLRPIKNPKNCFFQAHNCAYKHGLTVESENVAQLIGQNKEELESLWNYAEIKSYKYLDILSIRLNKIHGKNYSKEFWKRVFSLDLLKSISLIHQFYTYASKNFDPKIYSCEILSEKSYQFINDFSDQTHLLASSSIGQEQLFSMYIKCFFFKSYPEFESQLFTKKIIDKKTINSSSLKKYFNLNLYSKKKIFNKIRHLISELNCLKSDPVLGILGSYFDQNYFEVLNKNSNGKIQQIKIPKLPLNKSIDLNLRDLLSKPDQDMDDFDKFFFYSLKFLMPKYLVENFSQSVFEFNLHLKKYTMLKYIISESWLGNCSINFFRALAFEKQEVKTFYNEHNCIFYPWTGNFVNFKANLVDKYLTFGWGMNDSKFVKLASLFNFVIEKKIKKYDILYMSNPLYCRSKFYSSGWSNSGAGAIKQLDFVSKFLKNIPPMILKKMVYRSYPKDYSYEGIKYDKELILEKYLKHMKQLSSYKNKGETGKEAMAASSIVVTDFLSTSYLESLKMNIPIIAFCDPKSFYLNEEYSDFFTELIDAKIIHTSPESAASHLRSIFPDPSKWWNSQNTQNLKKIWLDKNFGDPQVMINYLLKTVNNK